MILPKIGEIWLTNNGTRYKILYVSNKFIISALLSVVDDTPIGESAWKIVEPYIRNIDQAMICLESKVESKHKVKVRMYKYDNSWLTMSTVDSKLPIWDYTPYTEVEIEMEEP